MSTAVDVKTLIIDGMDVSARAGPDGSGGRAGEQHLYSDAVPPGWAVGRGCVPAVPGRE